LHAGIAKVYHPAPGRPADAQAEACALRIPRSWWSASASPR